MDLCRLTSRILNTEAPRRAGGAVKAIVELFNVSAQNRQTRARDPSPLDGRERPSLGHGHEFRDDECRIRTDHAPANFTTIKHMAL